MSRPFLSIVIPAFNEEARLPSTLEQAVAFLKTRSYDWEVVVADDGSADGTAALVETCSLEHPEVRLLPLTHRGKGWAVKNGMLAAKGEYRFLCDADLSMPIEQVERFLPPQLNGVDVAIGSREMAESKRIGDPARRRYGGRFYNGLVRALAVPGIADTQCGFKCFRGEVTPRLFQPLRIDGFAFDVEVLFLALQAGLSVQEVAIDWYFREQSKVRPLRDPFAMIWDLLNIRWRHLRGQYNLGR